MAAGIWHISNEINCPADKVEAVLFNIQLGNFTADNAPLILGVFYGGEIQFENGIFTVKYDAGHKAYITIDKEKHTISVSGQWWYKGVYTVVADGNTTLLKYEIYNNATKEYWAGFIMGFFSFKQNMRAFRSLVSAITDRCV